MLRGFKAPKLTEEYIEEYIERNFTAEKLKSFLEHYGYEFEDIGYSTVDNESLESYSDSIYFNVSNDVESELRSEKIYIENQANFNVEFKARDISITQNLRSNKEFISSSKVEKINETNGRAA